MAAINLGVDFGGTALRAAFGAPGEPPTTVELSGLTWPWLLCESTPRGQLPVTFPSLKSRLGLARTANLLGESLDPAAEVTRALSALRARALADSSDHIGHTVISVPARYYTRQRRALVAAAAAAGLGDIGLVTDSVVAAVQHMGDGGPGTLLVYGMGYGGFELGLVRAEGATFRAMGYEGATSPGGGSLDALILRAWHETERRAGAYAQDRPRRESRWWSLRDRAERLKEELLSDRNLLQPYDIPGPGGRTSSTGDRPSFQRYVRVLLSRTVERATALLRQVEQHDDELAAVLLVGGATRMPAVVELASGLGSPVIPTTHAHLSLGALRCAHHAAQRSAVVSDDLAALTEGRATEPTMDTRLFTSALLDSPRVAAEDAAASPVDTSRRMIGEGRLDEAEETLRGLVSEARRLLDDIAVRRLAPSAARDSTARFSVELATAREHFRAGRYAEAVGATHAAWGRGDNPTVFEEMIDLHCRAAMADPTPASFRTDITWLNCALHNDPANPRVRELLAERHYLQGRELHRAGRIAEARRVVNHALNWRPDHPEATALSKRLDRRR
ncbi:MAG TPA: Hsp70 family protein [Stackebrandtia sp.]|uniref:Hsp70 family protein n=1 Tax=Stackebrandtia sp. TaxID=2023065 RepID=UPI002D721BF1|nr:Hsp70 family protein [Stackebrandtia sp.]HZE37931.1 Hsp70 family protein [Stackebrandtia sp.]